MPAFDLPRTLFTLQRASAGVYLVLLGCYLGFMVPIHWMHGEGVIAKWSVSSEIDHAKSRIALNERKLAAFSAGRKAFASESEPAGGVGQFHDSRGYLSPDYFDLQDSRVHVYFGKREMNGIFSSYGEARHYWYDQPSRNSSATGKQETYYAAFASEELAQDQGIVRELPTAESKPLRVKLPLFAASALFPALLLLGFGLIADLTGGLLRLFVDFLRHRRTSGPLGILR